MKRMHVTLQPKARNFLTKIILKKENALPKTYGFIHLGDSKSKEVLTDSDIASFSFIHILTNPPAFSGMSIRFSH